MSHVHGLGGDEPTVPKAVQDTRVKSATLRSEAALYGRQAVGDFRTRLHQGEKIGMR